MDVQFRVFGLNVYFEVTLVRRFPHPNGRAARDLIRRIVQQHGWVGKVELIKHVRKIGIEYGLTCENSPWGGLVGAKNWVEANENWGQIVDQAAREGRR